MIEELKTLADRMRRAAQNCMKSYDAGHVVDAAYVDDWADEIDTLIAAPLAPRFIVILLDDEPRCHCGCSPQRYLLACRNAWTTREAAERYADACSESRQAMVIECPRGTDFRRTEQ